MKRDLSKTPKVLGRENLDRLRALVDQDEIDESEKVDGSFQMSTDEAKKARVWIASQESKAHDNTAIGGRFTFSFTNTGIGTSVRIHDNLLKEETDVTNYDTW